MQSVLVDDGVCLNGGMFSTVSYSFRKEPVLAGFIRPSLFMQVTMDDDFDKPGR